MPGLRIVCGNPLDHGEELKQLFLANDRPEFPEFFERAYPKAVERGAKSWMGIDANGCIVLHVARFPHAFLLGERTATGGLLVNLMAAKEYRTLIPALTLVRQVVADSERDGDVDFLYGDPNPSAAAVLKLAGFKTAGTLKRFALPLAGQHWYTDIAVRAYRAAMRLRAWTGGLRAVQHDARDFDVAPFERPAASTPGMRPFRPPYLYEQRLASYPTARDYWFTFHDDARSHGPAVAALVRGDLNRSARLLALSRNHFVPLSRIVPALSAALRRLGYSRLFVFTLAGTSLSRELTGAGLVARQDAAPLTLRTLTPLGEQALGDIASWEVTELDCDR